MSDASQHAPKEWDELAAWVGEFLSRFPPAQTGAGLAGIEERWNAALAEPAADAQRQEQRLKALQNTWRWAKGRAQGRDEALKQLHAFVERSLQAPVREAGGDAPVRAAIARHPREDLLQRIQRALAGVGAAVERQMTPATRRAGQGDILLDWNSGDATLHWKDRPQSVVRLRAAAQRAFAVQGEVPGPEALWLADQLVAELADRHELCLPCFAYPPNLTPGEPPPTLHWTRGKTTAVPESDLPLRMQTQERLDLHVPAELELDLAGQDPKLANFVDQVVYTTVLADQREREKFAPAAQPHVQIDALGRTVVKLHETFAPAPPQEEETSSRLVDLIEFVAARTGRAPTEVVALFRQALLLGQRDVRGPEDANVRLQALALLWAYLNEPE